MFANKGFSGGIVTVAIVVILSSFGHRCWSNVVLPGPTSFAFLHSHCHYNMCPGAWQLCSATVKCLHFPSDLFGAFVGHHPSLMNMHLWKLRGLSYHGVILNPQADCQRNAPLLPLGWKILRCFLHFSTKGPNRVVMINSWCSGQEPIFVLSFLSSLIQFP